MSHELLGEIILKRIGAQTLCTSDDYRKLRDAMLSAALLTERSQKRLRANRDTTNKTCHVEKQ